MRASSVCSTRALGCCLGGAGLCPAPCPDRCEPPPAAAQSPARAPPRPGGRRPTGSPAPPRPYPSCAPAAGDPEARREDPLPTLRHKGPVGACARAGPRRQDRGGAGRPRGRASAVSGPLYSWADRGPRDDPGVPDTACDNDNPPFPAGAGSAAGPKLPGSGVEASPMPRNPGTVTGYDRQTSSPGGRRKPVAPSRLGKSRRLPVAPCPVPTMGCPHNGLGGGLAGTRSTTPDSVHPRRHTGSPLPRIRPCRCSSIGVLCSCPGASTSLPYQSRPCRKSIQNSP